MKIDKRLYAEGLYAITIVPTRHFDDMIKAADAGDREARHAALAFANWTKQVEVAAKTGSYPACFNCEATITAVTDGGEGIGGIAVLYPTAGEGIAMVAVFCPDCEGFGKDRLIVGLKRSIEDETGLTNVEVH